MAIKRSQQNYSKPRSEVEQMVIDSHSPEERLETAVEKGNGNKGGFTKPSGFHKVGTDKEFVKQKEQLKNGGSIKRGPAQTPPGTKSPTNGEKKQDRQNTQSGSDQASRPKKPAQKTPDDLRAILAGMTGAKTAPEQTETKPKKAVAPDPAEAQLTKEAPKPVDVVAQDKQQNRRSQPDTRPAQTREKSQRTSQRATQTPDDLRAVLAKMTGKQTPEVKTGAVQSKQPQDRPDKKHPPTKTEAKVPASLQSALAEVLAKTQKNEAQKPTAAQQPMRQAQKTETPARTRDEKESEAPKSAQPEVVPVTQSPEPPVGGVRQPAFEPHVAPSAPDRTTVKKMLQTSGKDRPPGM